MANVQKQFQDFHEAIKLERFGEDRTLREKRDIIVNKLRDRLKVIFDERRETQPTFESFDQGSYALGTGVKPLVGDFDVDVGLRFDLNKNDVADPVTVKQWVHQALYGHTDDVRIKGPCVTVAYHLDKEPIYHVDLAVYAHDGSGSGAIYLARGKPGSLPKNKRWEQSDPQGLCQAIDEQFADEAAEQFRRCIRYLKRWRDVQFSAEGNAAPVGIGITVAGYRWFQPKQELVDYSQAKYRDNDLVALRTFVQELLNHFQNVVHDGEYAHRLQVWLPVEPYDDPFARMSNNQMAAFQEKLEALLRTLQYAEDSEVDPVEACTELQKQFGTDFRVPPKEDTGRSKAPAILSSSTSA